MAQLLRLTQIIGDKQKGIEPLIPIGRSSWWNGVKTGRFPQPIKLGNRTTLWRKSDIDALINGASQ